VPDVDLGVGVAVWAPARPGPKTAAPIAPATTEDPMRAARPTALRDGFKDLLLPCDEADSSRPAPMLGPAPWPWLATSWEKAKSFGNRPFGARAGGTSRGRAEPSLEMRRTAALAFVGAMLVAVPPATASVVLDRPIQPGARLTRPDVEPFGNRLPYKFYRCTIAFIFRDARRNLYTGTTGEKQCVRKVGARAFDENGRAFGTAVFQEFSPPAGSFTLIRIDRTRYRDVNPSVRGWGGPTGIARASREKRGDFVLFTGNGFVEGDVAQTQPRAGVLISYNARHFTADSLAELGDSGGPVIDASTGLAVGMISDFGTGDRPPTTDDGPSVLRILSDLAAHRIRLSLVTAPFSAPF